MTGAYTPGMGELLARPASAEAATWEWVHEVPGFRLECCALGEPCGELAVRERATAEPLMNR